MKIKLAVSALAAIATSAALGSGLYYVPNDTESSVPVAWSVGIDAIWDGNTNPGGITDGDESFSLNPHVGVSFVSVTPQTTVDVYARLGAIFYLETPAATGSDDVYGQARIGINLTHRFNERLRFSSQNFLSYGLEPDYSYGFASSRQAGEYFFWRTDNSIGYRWSKRFATYTGISLEGLNYAEEVTNSDRLTWTLYNQFRYQLSPQSVLTASYRYSQTDGNDLSTDSGGQYFLVGFEHRFSPNTIMILSTGAQLRDVDAAGGSSGTNPYLEMVLRSRVNTQFTVSTFVRYGVEVYDTVVGVPTGLAEFDERLTLRVGVTAEYQLSPSLSLFGGVNLINTMYGEGRDLTLPIQSVADAEETLFNAYVGVSLKFTEYLYGTLTYNFENSTSDVLSRDYDRNRISLGLRAEF